MKMIRIKKNRDWMKRNIPLIHMVDFWRGQKLSLDKGGSFNVELYMAVCQAKKNKNG